MTETNRPLKTIVFTASYGGGHNAVSNAIADAVRTYFPGQLDLAILDYMKLFAPGRDSVLRMLYVKSTLYFPWSYDLFFYLSDKFFATAVGRKVGGLGRPGVKGFLLKNRPDIVLSVYPTPAQVIPSLNLEQMPLTATLVTDFGAHSQWIGPKADLFLVAAPEVKTSLRRERHIPEEHIRVTGIPIRLVYTKPLDLAATRAEFKIKYDVVVLLMANGQTHDDLDAITRKLLALPVQILALCGKDQKIIDHVTALSQGTDKIMIFGMAKEMDELMRISNIMISKAGGITVSEALACALPIIMFRPYPGQEIYNQEYLLKHRAGFLANNAEEVYQQVKSLCDNPVLRTEIKENARQLGRPNAARDTCRYLIEEYHKHEITKSTHETAKVVSC